MTSNNLQLKVYDMLTDRHAINQAVSTNNNITVYSCLQQIESNFINNNFAIKYVINGTEQYKTNAKNYSVNTGEYLLLNQTSNVNVHINSKTNVVGLCINLQPQLLKDAVNYYTNANNLSCAIDLNNFFSPNNFLDQKYKAKHTLLGSHLSYIANNLNHLSATGYQSFYYELASKIVEDQIPLFKQLQNIPSLKQSTKKELWRRIAIAKDFIDQNYNKTLPIKKIASEAALSEFHFYRLFKNILGITPHQYILKKRLFEAKLILKQNKYCVNEAAQASGFSDIYSFSKAFKKEYGVAPSAIGRI